MSEIDSKNFVDFLVGREHNPTKVLDDCRSLVYLVLKKNRYPDFVYDYVDDLVGILVEKFLDHVGKAEYSEGDVVSKCYVVSRRWISLYLRDCKRYCGLDIEPSCADTPMSVDLSRYVDDLFVDPVVKSSLKLFLSDPLNYPNLVNGFSIFSIALQSATFQLVQ